MRIPRKKKKFYKKYWFKMTNIKRYIIKNTIKLDEWELSNGRIVWGCITRLKHDKL